MPFRLYYKVHLSPCVMTGESDHCTKPHPKDSELDPVTNPCESEEDMH